MNSTALIKQQSPGQRNTGTTIKGGKIQRKFANPKVSGTCLVLLGEKGPHSTVTEVPHPKKQHQTKYLFKKQRNKVRKN